MMGEESDINTSPLLCTTSHTHNSHPHTTTNLTTHTLTQFTPSQLTPSQLTPSQLTPSHNSQPHTIHTLTQLPTSQFTPSQLTPSQLTPSQHPHNSHPHNSHPHTTPNLTTQLPTSQLTPSHNSRPYNSHLHNVTPSHRHRCAPVDLILIHSDVTITCLECGRENPTSGLNYGGNKDSWCRRCHTKLSVFIEQCRFVQHQTGLRPDSDHSSMGAKKSSKKREPLIQVGKPLPELGACGHYKKSHRWLR